MRPPPKLLKAWQVLLGIFGQEYSHARVRVSHVPGWPPPLVSLQDAMDLERLGYCTITSGHNGATAGEKIALYIERPGFHPDGKDIVTRLGDLVQNPGPAVSPGLEDEAHDR